MSLTRKQRVFVDAYCGPANGNASEAARRAGYRVPAQQGSENLRKPEIRAEIDRIFSERVMPPSEVLGRLADQARGPGEAITVDEGGLVQVDVGKLQELQRKHIVKAVRFTDKGQQIVEFYDAQAALVHLGRHLKLFTDKTETHVTLDVLLNALPTGEREAVRTAIADALREE